MPSATLSSVVPLPIASLQPVLRPSYRNCADVDAVLHQCTCRAIKLYLVLPDATRHTNGHILSRTGKKVSGQQNSQWMTRTSQLNDLKSSGVFTSGKLTFLSDTATSARSSPARGPGWIQPCIVIPVVYVAKCESMPRMAKKMEHDHAGALRSR